LCHAETVRHHRFLPAAGHALQLEELCECVNIYV